MITLFSFIKWYILSRWGEIIYEDYLQSHAWKFRRKIVRWWASNRCQVCYTNKGILDTHHRTYDRE